MLRNPEFIRNIWIEFSLHRVIAMPAILGLLLLLSFLLGTKSTTEYLNEWDFVAWKQVADNSILLFYAICVVWGSKLAADSIVEEINNNSWDFQRLSSISPFSMLVGKMFGSTSFMWFGGIILLVVYVLSSYFAVSEAVIIAPEVEDICCYWGG